MKEGKMASQYPFQVHVVGGGIDRGFDKQEDAERAAKDKNARAEALKLQTRYEVKELSAA
jgi:hypothetical protein